MVARVRRRADHRATAVAGTPQTALREHPLSCPLSGGHNVARQAV
jgi:hypothetical protein